jgi:exonuclease VII large subunit
MFKHRNSSANKLVYTKRRTSCGSFQFEQENLEIKTPYFVNPSNIPPKNTQDQEKPNSNLFEKVNLATNTLLKPEKFAVKQSSSPLDTNYEKIQTQIKEIRQSKQKISNEITELLKNNETSILNIKKKSLETESNINKLNKTKNAEYKSLSISKSKLKFFKDLINLEILGISSNPLCLIKKSDNNTKKPRYCLKLQAKHENYFIQFQILDHSNDFDYHLIDTNIPVSVLPEYLTNDIYFPKSQFKIFYMELMELIYSLE